MKYETCFLNELCDIKLLNILLIQVFMIVGNILLFESRKYLSSKRIFIFFQSKLMHKLKEMTTDLSKIEK